jgi:hypothetical protein
MAEIRYSDFQGWPKLPEVPSFNKVSLRDLVLYSLARGVEGKPSTSTVRGPKAPAPAPRQRRIA